MEITEQNIATARQLIAHPHITLNIKDLNHHCSACSACNKDYKDRKNYLIYLNNVNFMFVSSETVRKHEDIIPDVDDPNYQCMGCKKKSFLVREVIIIICATIIVSILSPKKNGIPEYYLILMILNTTINRAIEAAATDTPTASI